MRVVLDTNVLISGLLTPFGTCAEILRLLVADRIRLCVDARILLEYEEVLQRPKFGFDRQKTALLLDFIRASSEFHAAIPLDKPLPDPDDAPFLEVALAAGAGCLVTGNLKHFPPQCRGGCSVLTPAEFMDAYRAASSS